MAGRVSDPILDEIQWHSPLLAQQMQGIHSNSILFYFANSPFFDQTSNNAVLFNQAQYNQNMHHLLATREAFEGRLKSMSGLEFIVAQEPAEMAPGTGTGVWVIRKQSRRKRPGQEDEVVVHSTYFVMGENVYMAPAVGDVIGSRLLSIFTSLNKFISTAASLPNFTPALGHTYTPSPPVARSKTTDSQIPQASKEATPLPDSLPPISTRKRLQPSINASTYTSSRLLSESLDLTLRYADEYMDENPITGHPGDFHLSTTGRKGRENPKTLPASKSSSQSQSQTKTMTGPPTPEKVHVDTNIPLVAPRKGSRGDKSPKTPGMPKPKRRKSKALGSAGGISPTL